MRVPTMKDLLTYNQRLRIECHGVDCGHKACWTPQEAIERLGAETTFEQAKRKLTCPVCKDRRPQKLISVYPDHTDYYAAMRSQGVLLPP